MLDSIQELDDEAAKEIAKRKAINDKISQNQSIIEEIKATIQQGITHKTELIKNVSSNTGESKKKIARVLKEHTGDYSGNGNIWSVRTSEKNSHIYSLNRGDYYA